MNLRPYQASSIDAIDFNFICGKNRQVLCASTGAGKSVMAVELIRRCYETKTRVMFVCDRRVLVEQFSRHLWANKIPHGIIMAGHPNRRYEPVQVCSVQTLEKCETWINPDLMIVDECFAAGTKISTPRGDIDIDLVRCGDSVYNQQGIGVVQQVFSKKSSEIYILEFSDGTSIECTGNHKFFTECGWVEAKEMAIGSYFFSIEGMRLLWKTVHTLDKERQEHSQNNISLQREIMECARNLLNILCKEIEKPYEQSSSKNEAESDNEREESQAYTSWRERAIIALGTACASSCSRGRMAGGTSSENEQGALKRGLSELLQAGYCKSRSNDRDRIRRSMSRIAREEKTGSKENRSSYFPRLVNLSRIEREGSIPVFDLQISGHPSYFANGKLVHNCHAVMRKSLLEFISHNQKIKVIGLTATPFHAELKNYFSEIVNVVTMEKLVQDGFLVPYRVFAATEINTTGLKTFGNGEWQKDELEKRGLQVVGDVVADYQKIVNDVFGGEYKKTIVFSSGVNHGAELVKKFAEIGRNFVQISYLDTEDFKADVLREFSKPHTSIDGVISTDILTRGFDQPDVEHVIVAKPLRKSFSQHVQMIGRGARPYSGKAFCVIQDNSGNWLRFADSFSELYHDGVKTLDNDADKRKRKEKTEKEKKQACCPKCRQIWVGRVDVCPTCGFVKERRSKVDAVAGTLAEINATKKKVDKFERSYQIDFYQQLLQFARGKGYQDGWAYYKFKDKFGTFPSGISKMVRPVTSEVYDWITSQNIKASYGRKRRRA